MRYFLSVCTSICMSVTLCLDRLTRKVVDGVSQWTAYILKHIDLNTPITSTGANFVAHTFFDVKLSNLAR